MKSPFIPENPFISSHRIEIPWNWNTSPCRFLWQMFIPSAGKCPWLEWQPSSWSSKYLQGSVLHQMANLFPNIFPECWEIIPDWMCLEQSQICLESILIHKLCGFSFILTRFALISLGGGEKKKEMNFNGYFRIKWLLRDCEWLRNSKWLREPFPAGKSQGKGPKCQEQLGHCVAELLQEQPPSALSWGCTEGHKSN